VCGCAEKLLRPPRCTLKKPAQNRGRHDKAIRNSSIVVPSSAARPLASWLERRVFFNTEELVVKPDVHKNCVISRMFSQIPFWGDGAVIMIIDPNGIRPKAARTTPATPRRRQLAQPRPRAHRRTRPRDRLPGRPTPAEHLTLCCCVPLRLRRQPRLGCRCADHALRRIARRPRSKMSIDAHMVSPRAS